MLHFESNLPNIAYIYDINNDLYIFNCTIICYSVHMNIFW